MAISITWATKIIYVPRSFLSLISGSRYRFDLDDFRLALKDLEDSEEGIASERTHNHVAPISVGAVTLARVVEILNGYTITFEDGSYSAEFDGANTNAADVVNVNQVSVRPNNSAGLTYSSIQEDLAYNGVVHLDVSGSAKAKSGLGNYVGTRPIPSDNLIDALAIAENFNISTIALAGTLTLDQSTNGYAFDNGGNGKIDLNNQFATVTRFIDLKVWGTQNLLGLFYDCRITDLQGLLGTYNNCKFLDSTPMLVAQGQTNFFNCKDQTEGDTSVILDLSNGTDANPIYIDIKDFTGKITFRNSTSANNRISIAMMAGHVILDSNNTAGFFCVGGITDLHNNSVGCTVKTKVITAMNDLTLTTNKFLALKD